MTDTTEIPRFRPLGPTTTPFDNIALAFSGGGFRAAGFGLGVLSYFNTLSYTENGEDRPLIKNITYLSSASSGTLATAMYALNDAQGKPFHTYYKHLFESLSGTVLLENTLKKLNENDVWLSTAHSKRRNLINAFALAYDEYLFHGARIADLEHATHSHLDEVCFNTTEFYKGILFRQTAKMKKDNLPDKDFLYGNFLVSLHRDAATHLKLADILAASSCFPAGFEPIMFPDDFTYSHEPHSLNAIHLREKLTVLPQELSWTELNLLYGAEHVKRTVHALHKTKPGFSADDLREALKTLHLDKDFEIGMMDGGITDNQGLESMMKANDRREKGQTAFKPFDLMIVNDVGSHFIDPYVLPGTDKFHNKTKGMGLTNILILSAVLTALGLGGFVTSLFYMGGSDWAKLAAAGSIMVMLIASIVLVCILAVRRVIRGKLGRNSGLNLAKDFSQGISKLFFHYFGSSVFIVLYSMMQERINSVILLNTSVFMKRIREVLYQKFFDSENHIFRIKTNHIYDISFSNDGNKDRHSQPSAGEPSSKLKTVAEAAFNMGTTLWFDVAHQKNNSQAAIIACGQFTTCYNLLLYIDTFRTSAAYQSYGPNDKYRLRVDELYRKLNEHYRHFNRDPFWLYNQIGLEAGIKDFAGTDASKFPFPEKFEGLRWDAGVDDANA